MRGCKEIDRARDRTPVRKAREATPVRKAMHKVIACGVLSDHGLVTNNYGTRVACVVARKLTGQGIALLFKRQEKQLLPEGPCTRSLHAIGSWFSD